MRNVAAACFTVGLAVLVLSLAACTEAPRQVAEPPDTRAADEAAIRAAVREWSASAQAKDMEKFVSYYAENAILMMEDAPDLSGKAALREGIAGMMQDPNFALSFEATGVEAARSSDLAYETGNYSLTTTDPATKKASTEKGRYVVIWKKQADGQWKVLIDAPVSDPPEAPGR